MTMNCRYVSNVFYIRCNHTMCNVYYLSQKITILSIYLFNKILRVQRNYRFIGLVIFWHVDVTNNIQYKGKLFIIKRYKIILILLIDLFYKEFFFRKVTSRCFYPFPLIYGVANFIALERWTFKYATEYTSISKSGAEIESATYLQ